MNVRTILRLLWQPFSLSGRASRREVAYVALTYLALYAFCTIRMAVTGTRGALFILWFLGAAPSFSVMYRRLHDIGRSGLWLVPVILVLSAVSPITMYASGIPMDIGGVASTFAISCLAQMPLLLILVVLFIDGKGDDGPNRFGYPPSSEVRQ